MRKTRKFFTGLLCAAMVFSSVLPVNAEQARIAVTRCPECFTGAVSSHEISRKYITSKEKECIHAKEHWFPDASDVYYVWDVTYEMTCNSCSYKTNVTKRECVFAYCNG